MTPELNHALRMLWHMQRRDFIHNYLKSSIFLKRIVNLEGSLQELHSVRLPETFVGNNMGASILVLSLAACKGFKHLGSRHISRELHNLGRNIAYCHRLHYRLNPPQKVGFLKFPVGSGGPFNFLLLTLDQRGWRTCRILDPFPPGHSH